MELEQRISNLIEPKVEEMGFEIVKLSFCGGDRKILQILIDRLDNKYVTARDCQLLSREISVLLDVENVITDKYLLEVSSAGLERPLVKLKDYKRFIDRKIKIQLNKPIEENNITKYKGQIIKVEDDIICIKHDGGYVKVKLADIKKARLVLTDKMFKIKNN